jgi:deoxyadenosine kinase
MRFKHIATEGIIAAGKSTLAEMLAMFLGGTFIPEPVDDNPYLPEFYSDLDAGICRETRSAAMMQLRLLHLRYQALMQAIYSKGLYVEDRTIFGDTVFAAMLRASGQISDIDYDTYCIAYDSMKCHMLYPDVVVYLACSPELAKKRADERSRDVESKLTLAYLTDLHNNYVPMIQALGKHTPIITVQSEWPTEEQVAYVVEQFASIESTISPYMTCQKSSGMGRLPR